MSIENRKLFAFVSKLIFDTNAGVLLWEKNGTSYQGILEKVGDSFTAKVPGNRTLHFSVTLDTKQWYQGFHGNGLHIPPQFMSERQWLRNCIKDANLEMVGDGKTLLSLNLLRFHSLAELYLTIFYKSIGDDDVETSEAEQTIDLILNANKEIVSI